MVEEGDMSLVNDVLEPFRRVLNSKTPKDKLSSSSKLSFSEVNQSSKGIPSYLNSKRKSNTPEDTAAIKRSRTDLLDTTTNQVPTSPWEYKRLRADLIAAKSRITKLEGCVNQQHSLRKEMQVLFDDEKATLVEQHKRDERALNDMENRLEVIRRREKELRDDYNELSKEYKENKLKWDKEKISLQKQVAELKSNLLDANSSTKGQLSEIKNDMDELLEAYKGAQSEVDILKNELEKQTSKAEQCTSFQTQLEKQTFELQQLNNKLKEFELERESYKDFQQQVRVAQKRLINMTDLEKEVTRLRASEKTLRDAICNKLLLEEQVHQLTARVESLQSLQTELQETKIKLATAESAVEEWANVARRYGAEGARALATALEDALAGRLAAAAEAAALESRVAQLNEELSSMKFERDKATTKLTDLQSNRKNHESIIHRLQKRLHLVTRERDSYREQLDCYEKELSVSLSGEGGAGSAALLSARVEQLERALQGYRDLLAAHDSQAHDKLVSSLRAQAARAREDAEAARREAAQLRAQRDGLQAHFDRLQSTAAQTHTKVLHLTNNPAAAAHQELQAQLESAQEEVKRLKSALSEGGTGLACENVQQMRQQLDNSQLKLKRMKEEFTSSAQEYRDVCYMLLGYKVDRTGPKNYRLSSMYAESAEEYLTFTLCDDGIEMVHTDYSATLTELVELHLHQHHSIPLFLSSLTMDLFTKTTMQQEAQ